MTHVNQFARLEHIFDPQGIAEQLEFGGFASQAVIEVGSGSGEFSRIALKMGATSLTCVEPRIGTDSLYPVDDRLEIIQKPIETAVAEGDLHPANLVVVYNVAPWPDRPDILRRLPQIVAPGGQLVITTAERGMLSPVSELEDALGGYFQSIKSSPIRPASLLGNNNIIVANN